MVQVRVQVETEVIRSEEEAAMHAVSAKYMLVTLTKGVLRDITFTDILLKMCEQDSTEIVTVLADVHFDFPDAGFFARLEQARRLSGLSLAEDGGNVDPSELCGRARQMQVKSPEHGMRLSQVFRDLLNVLALGFSPHGAIGIQDAQVDAVVRRFKGFNDSEWFLKGVRGSKMTVCEGKPIGASGTKLSEEMPIGDVVFL
jgi:hypothetical protein